MATNDYLFTLFAGETIKDGKPHWPDLVRLVIPRDRALDFAMDVLRSLQQSRPNEDLLMERPLFGRLEPLADDKR